MPQKFKVCRDCAKSKKIDCAKLADNDYGKCWKTKDGYNPDCRKCRSKTLKRSRKKSRTKATRQAKQVIRSATVTKSGPLDMLRNALLFMSHEGLVVHSMERKTNGKYEVQYLNRELL